MFLVDLQARVTAMKQILLSPRPIPEILGQACQQLSGIEITLLNKKLYKKMTRFAVEFNQIIERYDIDTVEAYQRLCLTDQHRLLAMLQDICQRLQRFIHLASRKNVH